MAGPGRTENLIVQTAFLGDVLLGAPFFKQLRRLKPNSQLTLLCRRGYGDLLTRLGLVDEAIEVDKSSRESWRAAVATLKARRFDHLFCPHQSMRSLLLIARLRARVKIGYKGSIAGLVFHHRVRRPMELPEALRQLALLEPLEPVWSDRLRGFAQRQALPGGQRADGSLVEVPEWAEMQSIDRLRIENLSESARKIAVRLGHAPLAFLAPGSVWPTKMWRAEGFAQAAAELSKRGFKVVLMGSPEERDICERIRQSAPSAEVIAGETDLFATTQLLSMASIFIGNDSGAMHLAALAGVPSVAVFGPTILDFGYRPWESRAAVVQVPREKMSCRPCGKHGARSCPLGTHACMREVQASEVVTTALRLSGIDA